MERTQCFELCNLSFRSCIFCEVRGIDPADKLRVAREEVRLIRAFGSGTVRKGKCRRERGDEVAVRERQGRRMRCAGAEGFVPGIASKCTFFHTARTIRIVVHGDDFVIEGDQEDLDRTK